jgi:predicted permease
MMAVSLTSVFVSAVLPVLAVASLGFVIGRFKDVEADPLNTITVFVL